MSELKERYEAKKAVLKDRLKMLDEKAEQLKKKRAATEAVIAKCDEKIAAHEKTNAKPAEPKKE